MNSKLKKYLDDYFGDWNLSEEEKKELNEHINTLESNLNYIYDMVEVIKLSEKNQDTFMATLDELIQEVEEDVTSDT